MHTSNEEVEKALSQANKDRETLFQRCVELTAQLQAAEDRLKRAEEAERQTGDLRARLAEAERDRDAAKDRELNNAGAPAAAGGATEGAAAKSEDGAAKEEGLEVKLLQEKVRVLVRVSSRS